LRVLAALDQARLATIIERLEADHSIGRPWSLSLTRRVLLTCIALRTNLTFRELAAVCGTTTSTAHRTVAAIVPKLAALAGSTQHDRRWSWIVDGTLIPTRDHACAARSKNDRWSCNAQIVVRRADLRVIATAAGGPGNRNDPIHYRGSIVESLCRSHGHVLADGGYRGVPELVIPRFRGNRIVRDARWRWHRHRRARVEHAIARLKNWRALRDHRRRGPILQTTLQAIVGLHNLQIDLRDKP
jgi:hypothetical protein